MNTDKLAIIWQNFARVRLQLKFAFIIRPRMFLGMKDFDFYPNRIKFTQIFPKIYSNFAQILSSLSKFTKILPNLPKLYPNLSKFYPNLTKLA